MDPIIVSLTYFRSEFPVILLFYAFGMTDRSAIFALVKETAHSHTLEDIRRHLHPTMQHAMTVNTQNDALLVLMRSTQQHNNRQGGSHHAQTDPISATYDLLCANVLPHLSTVENKCKYVAHMVGLIINYITHGPAKRSVQYDKDHMGNKRVDTCGALLGQHGPFFSRRSNASTNPERPVSYAWFCDSGPL